jgi:site-specific DNA recombinase
MSTEHVLDGYIRVSSVAGRAGDRFHSPAAQRDAIDAWAKANGVRIARYHEDLDRSGGTMDRPGLNTAIQRVDAGKTGGIVVAKIDRFSRTLIGGLTVIRDLHERGARVVSVAESIDPTTAVGRAMLGLVLVMAEWVRDQADEHIAAAQLRAAEQGRYAGRTPYGYRRNTEGQVEVDPGTAPVVQRIFERRAAGEGWGRIAQDLTADGIPTPRGQRVWARVTPHDMVKGDAYLGVFRGPRGMVVHNAWPALVTQELWDAANDRAGVDDRGARHQDRLFAGLARCGHCGRVMRRAKNPHGYVSYACLWRGCTQRGSVGAQLLDDLLTARVDERLAGIALDPVNTDGGEGDRLAAARDAAVRELEAWRDDLTLRQALGNDDWRQGLMARARARDDAETALVEHRSRAGLADLDEITGGRQITLGELPWELRREVVRTLLRGVWVTRSPRRGLAARQHLAERVRWVWADQPIPADLPVASADRPH